MSDRASAAEKTPLKGITLLLGRAATGKTRWIYERIRALQERGSRAILLVPEQFTFETEQRLLEELGGLVGIEVLSFGRLAERISAASASVSSPSSR